MLYSHCTLQLDLRSRSSPPPRLHTITQMGVSSVRRSTSITVTAASPKHTAAAAHFPLSFNSPHAREIRPFHTGFVEPCGSAQDATMSHFVCEHVFNFLCSFCKAHSFSFSRRIFWRILTKILTSTKNFSVVINPSQWLRKSDQG